MSDRKSTSKQKRKKATGRKKRDNWIALSISTHRNEYIYDSRWEYGQLSSTTAGNISAGNISGSIANSSESSQIGALFGEIRLLSLTVVFGSKANSLSTVSQGTILVGTSMYDNQNNATTPTNITFVQNLENKREIESSIVKNVRYRMKVPRDLEFTQIAQDAPTPPQPFAGSPGCVRVWGSAFTPSTAYFDVFVEARWHLRARQ